MIVCDKCRGPAEYKLSVDYLHTKDLARYDLCEKHYNEMIAVFQEPDLVTPIEKGFTENRGSNPTKRGRTKKTTR